MDLYLQGENLTSYKLEELLSLKQIYGIVESSTKSQCFTVEKWILTKASEGLAGYLGDHLRLNLLIDVEGKKQDIKLFIKCMPNQNRPKKEYLEQYLFYKREQFVYNELLKDAGGFEGLKPWRPKVHICDEQIVVMPDLSASGYCVRDKRLWYDLEHTLATVTAIAKYHAASVNNETKKSRELGRDYDMREDHPDLIGELNFVDCPWVEAGAKATVNFLGEFSNKYKFGTAEHDKIANKLHGLFLQACSSIKPMKDTVNVVIHKDIWAHNVMFKYASAKPVSAILLDFQCVRYAPPAFDVSIFLYLNTPGSLRKVHEKKILQSYYITFARELTNESVKRINWYSFEKFYKIYEASRMFGLLVPVMIFPYICMDPVSAKKTFDNPTTYERYNNEDRTEPVIENGKMDPIYKEKLLDVFEEFADIFAV